MSPNRAINAYQSAMQTTPPLQAVVLLYDGILVRLHNAIDCADRRDYAEQFNQVIRATDILRGLIASIDDKKGGPLADRLRETYEINMRAMLRAVGQPDSLECLRRIGSGLRELRNAWAEIAGMPHSVEPSSAR